MRSFVGVYGFQIGGVADDMEVSRDAVAPVHIARHAGDVERLTAIVALEERNEIGLDDAVLDPAANAKRRLQAEADFGHHIGKLHLHELFGINKSLSNTKRFMKVIIFLHHPPI